jgi:drug/metabolite transporter (DMT)-like permease
MARRPVLSTSPGTRSEAFGPAEWLLLGGVALMWGSSFLWIAEGVASFSPPVVTSGRLVLGALTLVAFRRRPVEIDRSDWPQIVVLSLVWMVVPFSLFPIAQQWVDSGIAGMINGSTPLFAGLLAALLLRRRPGTAQGLGLLIGFAGVVLITLPAALEAEGSPLGVGLITLAAALYGLALNMAVPLQQRYGAIPVLLRAQAVAIVVTLPFGIAGITASEWTWSSAGAVALLGVFSTGLALVAATTLTGRAGATRGSVAVYFLPVVAMVLGVVVRDESIPALSIAGTALVVAGAWLSSRREAPPLTPAGPPVRPAPDRPRP